jgi:inner membrane protein
MDPLTQGLLGATVGQAMYGRLLGRRAVVWGALVGMTPDLDVLATPLRPDGDWVWHRGPTHDLVFGALVGPAIGWLVGSGKRRVVVDCDRILGYRFPLSVYRRYPLGCEFSQ